MTTLTNCHTSRVGHDIFGRSWEGRRVAVIGLGKSGSAAAELLCSLGCRVYVTDNRDTEELQEMRQSLLERGASCVQLGDHSRELIEQSDVVIVSPGVPESSWPVKWAIESARPILSEIELAFQFCHSPVIAVTGTNGKSTVVTLIVKLLQLSGRSAVACGNLGIPFSSVIDKLDSQSVAVVEVSSFQLLWCHHLRPKIGVFLNIGTNHLDRHMDKRAYLASKAKLFERQSPDDWALLNGLDPDIVSLGQRLAARRVWFGENQSNAPEFHLAAQTQSCLTPNMQAVLQVGRIMGIPDVLSWQIIRSFRGLEHRLEYVATIRNVHYVNDSKSTTPDSLLFALSQTRGEVVVIVGGRDKGLDFKPLIGPLNDERVKGVVLIGESRSRLREILSGSAAVLESDKLDDAVQAAAGLARSGTTVLLSPACASFDMFRDFEDRGRAFKAIVHRLAQPNAGN